MEYVKWQKRRNLPVLKIFILLILLILFLLICVFLHYILKNDSGNEIPPRPVMQNNTQILTYDRLIRISEDYLLLINNEHKIPQNISGDLVKVTDYVKTLKTDNLLNENAAVMLKEMLDAAAADAKYTEFRVTEGYRTREYQQSLYDSATDKSLVALPDYSEHQTGFAVDISYNGVNIGNSRQGKWLADNSYKYGFILRYPKNKEHITGISFEPWHYRYIGQPHAYFCYKNDLCLEEYIDYLKGKKEISVKFNGIEYMIYYLSDTGEIIGIPQNYSYSASSDNTGGIIITFKKPLDVK